MLQSTCPYDRIILVCHSEGPDGRPDCGGGNPGPLADALRKAVADAGLTEKIPVMKTPCMGLCEKGPNVMIFPEGTVFSGVRPEDVPAIAASCVKARKR